MGVELDDNFQTVMELLKEDCVAIGKGMRGTEQLRWAFSTAEGSGEETQEKPGKFDFTGVRELFNRKQAEATYEKALSSPESYTKHDMAVATSQSDVLSGMERDFLMRSRTRIRKLAHEASCRGYAGTKNGVIELGILEHFNEQVRRASTTGTNGD